MERTSLPRKAVSATRLLVKGEELTRLAKKAAKLAEKEAKQAARGSAPVRTWGEPKKEKKEKAKVEGVSVTEWINPTPAGQRKGASFYSCTVPP